MKSIRILAIGNSFSISVGEYLAQFVNASGNAIKFVSACIGGCSLQRHWESMEQADADENFRPYDYTVWYNANGRIRKDWVSEKRGGTVNQMMKDDVFDFITIQQASHFSWQPDTYQPYADNLIQRIRKDQPQATILVQQTWSYRSQDRRLQPGSEWGIDQTEMYHRLDGAYRKLADQYGFTRIPTGTAVQISRERTENKFKPYTAEQLASYRWPDLPSQCGDVVGAMHWGKNEEGKLVIGMDNIHLNKRGEFLQACVWYGVIYGEDPRNVDWSPAEIDKEDGKFLRECAYEALKAEGIF